MKVYDSIIACSLISFAAAAPSASVYTFDQHSWPSKSSSNAQSSLSFEDARLVLAQRLGLAGHYSLDGASDSTVKLLNEAGGSHPSLFSRDDNRLRRLLVVVDGADTPEDIVPSEWTATFKISQSSKPHPSDLIQDFLSSDIRRRRSKEICEHSNLVQDKPATIRGAISSKDPLGICTISIDINGISSLDIVKGEALSSMAEVYQKEMPLSYLDGSIAMFHISLEAAFDQSRAQTPNSAQIATKLKLLLSDIALFTNQESTVIVARRPLWRMPKGSKPRTTKGKRAVTEPRVSPKEAPIPTMHSSKKTKPSLQELRPAQSPSTPRTTMPFCWASAKACMEKTANCTGHGSCNKKYTEKASADEEGPECWACQCAPSVEPLDGGATRTTHWGGPACQKKDISVQFFLLAGFTVAALAMISWGIGLLYSIGQEDLPSVLGAGVAPVMHK